VTVVCFLLTSFAFSAVHDYLMTDATLAHVSKYLGTTDIILSSVSKVIVVPTAEYRMFFRWISYKNEIGVGCNSLHRGSEKCSEFFIEDLKEDMIQETRHRWESNIKMDLRITVFEDMNCLRI